MNLTYLVSRVGQRANTAEEWVSQNPILLAGEMGVELGTGRVKIGDGIHFWTSLPYWTNGSETYTATNGISISGTTISATLLYDEIT